MVGSSLVCRTMRGGSPATNGPQPAGVSDCWASGCQSKRGRVRWIKIELQVWKFPGTDCRTPPSHWVCTINHLV
jgi:hypothetical protein